MPWLVTIAKNEIIIFDQPHLFGYDREYARIARSRITPSFLTPIPIRTDGSECTGQPWQDSVQLRHSPKRQSCEDIGI